MPRPSRSQGRPGTQVIPADWSPTHRPVIAKTCGVTIAVRRPDSLVGTFDPDTGARAAAPFAPHFVGAARITIVNNTAREHLVAGMEVSTVAYRVSVDAPATLDPPDGVPVVGCLVEITTVDANGIPSLLGRELTVESLGRGSLQWEQVLLCTDKLDGSS